MSLEKEDLTDTRSYMRNIAYVLLFSSVVIGTSCTKRASNPSNQNSSVSWPTPPPIAVPKRIASPTPTPSLGHPTWKANPRQVN
jgi:hypothetical protein